MLTVRLHVQDPIELFIPALVDLRANPTGTPYAAQQQQQAATTHAEIRIETPAEGFLKDAITAAFGKGRIGVKNLMERFCPDAKTQNFGAVVKALQKTDLPLNQVLRREVFAIDGEVHQLISKYAAAVSFDSDGSPISAL